MGRKRKHTLHTIGHSNMEIEAFINLLERGRTELVADVRSTPYSRRVPHFNREKLAKALTLRNIGYVFMGEQLGGRPKADRLYDEEGRADYRLMALEAGFQEGIQQLARTASKHRTVLLCTEKDPLRCHRALLVTPALERAGISVTHLLENGRKKTHEELMDKLLTTSQQPLRPRDGTSQEKAWTEHQQAVELAVEQQARRAAYRRR